MRKGYCMICGDKATKTCQYCGAALCTPCKKLEKECLNYRITQEDHPIGVRG